MTENIYTLEKLATLINAQLRGDPKCQISGVAPLDRAQAGQISFLANPQFRQYLPTTQASAVILSSKETDKCQTNILITENPYLGYAKIATLFSPKLNNDSGIHSTAVIGKNCQIDPSASIGAHCVIDDAVTIGKNTVISAGCKIGRDVTIGKDCHLWANVTLYHNVRIGNRVMIHSGAVIGSDGFGLAKDEKNVWHKIPQLGGVVIGDDVEVGANTTIDRGALDDTVIEEGVKLDNLIQIAHNVYIGAHTVIAGCTGIAGSARIGKYCMIGGGASIVGHSEIVDNVVLIGTAVVERSIEEPGVYASGLGILPFRVLKRLGLRFRQLEDMARRLNKLEKDSETR